MHRSLLDWEWYDDANVARLFLHCLFMANHKDKKYRGTVVKRGTFLTGRELLAEQTGLTVRQVRTALSKLESTNELTIKSSPKGTVVEVVNYHTYQGGDQQNDQLATNKRPASDQQTTSNKKDKKEKNDKNNTTEQIYAAYPRRVGKQKALKSIEKALVDTPADQILEHLKLYSESVKDKENQFIPHPATYFNQGRHLEPVEVIQPAKKKLPLPWEL